MSFETEQTQSLKTGTFVGRETEQARFREMLLDMVGVRKGFFGSLFGNTRQNKISQKIKSRLILIGGKAGSGKTRLAQKLREIAQKDKDFAGRFRITRIDWQEIYERDGRFNALLPGETLSPQILIDVIQSHCVRDNGAGYFEEYTAALEFTKDLAATVKEAELEAVWTYRVQALGRSLKQWSADRPIIFFMDNFQLVAAASSDLLKPLLEESGPAVFLVLSGEKLPLDLAEQLAPERFAEFKARSFDEANLRKFYELELGRYDATADIQQFRVVFDSMLTELEKATADLPLAARLVTFLLQTGLTIKDLSLEEAELIASLVETFATDPLGAGHPDRLKLYALVTLRRPEEGLLSALFDLRKDMLPVGETLGRFRERYDFLFEPGRLMILHAAIQKPLSQWLFEPTRRYDQNGLAKITERGFEYLDSRLNEWSDNFPSLAEQVNDLKWREWALDKVWYGFWQSEDKGWPQALALLTAGLGSRPALAAQTVALLYRLAELGALNEVGQRRLKIFHEVVLDSTAARQQLRELRVMGQDGGYFKAAMPEFASELSAIMNNLLK